MLELVLRIATRLEGISHTEVQIPPFAPLSNNLSPIAITIPLGKPITELGVHDTGFAVPEVS